MDNNVKTNKSLFKIIIVIIDIIAIIGLIILLIKWNSNHSNNIDNTNNNVALKEIKYKKFTFKVPNDISYNEIDNKKFKLTSNNYEAIIEIFIDKANYIFDKSDKYYQLLLNLGYNIEKPYEDTIDDIPVLIFNKHIDDTNNSLLCYFLYSDLYLIEIELYNTDNTFRLDFLDSLVDIMMNSKLNEDKNKNYTYSTINFSEY